VDVEDLMYFGFGGSSGVFKCKCAYASVQMSHMTGPIKRYRHGTRRKATFLLQVAWRRNLDVTHRVDVYQRHWSATESATVPTPRTSRHTSTPAANNYGRVCLRFVCLSVCLRHILAGTNLYVITLAASIGKRNVTVWRPSV